ncbi:MAG: GntR family transcriptional regulator [Deltaproteobacteria bacterium]|nr:GntR family transcriptional regulator [Deltaproteobacteria bacterium]
MTDTAPQTRSDWVYERLKQAIVSGELPPGTRLVATDLAQRWAVSPTPLREAFQRLEGLGLVELCSQRGARVASVSVAEAEEIYELRLVLDPWALRRSLERSDAVHRAEIAAAYQRLVDAISHHPSSEDRTLLEVHRAFHAVLLAQCPSAWLRRLTSLLADHSLRYQLLGASYAQGVSDSMVEHERLREAALAGDVEQAVRLLTAHLQGSLHTVQAALEGRQERSTATER